MHTCYGVNLNPTVFLTDVSVMAAPHKKIQLHHPAILSRPTGTGAICQKDQNDNIILSYTVMIRIIIMTIIPNPDQMTIFRSNVVFFGQGNVTASPQSGATTGPKTCS